jgi:RNA polymerase sigma-B factor
MLNAAASHPSPEAEPGSGDASKKKEPAANSHATPAGKAHEEFLLRRYAQTREPALQTELVERFMPLARSLALRYRGGSEPLDDLVQVASLGLVKALEGYDPERGRSFTAYAVPTMLGELRRHFRDRVWNVHLPRGLQERAMEVSDAVQTLSDELGSSPTVAQIADHIDASEEEVLEAMQADAARRTLSLDLPQGRDDDESAPMVDAIGNSEMGYEAVESQLAAGGADLDERELVVLRLRFGRDLNQYEIGRRLGVSQMQISRIMRRALRKLLDAVQDDELQVELKDKSESV